MSHLWLWEENRGLQMGIFKTFSKRQKELKGETKDVFTYNEIPDALRVQICHIWRDCMGVEMRDYMGTNPIYP